MYRLKKIHFEAFGGHIYAMLLEGRGASPPLDARLHPHWRNRYHRLEAQTEGIQNSKVAEV